MARHTGSTNPILRKLIRQLRELSREKRAKIWSELADRLDGPRRSRAEVNLSQLSRYTMEGETVVVPGKVLAAGKIDRPLTVAAFKFSAAARRKVAAAGGKALTIQQLIEENPNSAGVKLME